jgi:succinate dehydrogenase / fumarate reductase cytochrome b subunit
MTITIGSDMSTRPKYLNLFQIKLPMPGIISIMHRVSGAVLFFALPVLLYVFQESLISFGAFTDMRNFFSNVLVKLVVLGLFWGFFHHLCAGIRYLALDLDIGVDLASARASSFWVFGGGIVLTLLMGWKIW